MKKDLFIFLLIVLFSSCLNNKILKTSDEEKNAVEELLTFYGGNCEYGSYFEISNDGSKHYFDLKLKESSLIGNPKTDDILAAGVAYRFYNSLKKEANKFDQINTELIDSNGMTKKYTFDTSVLNKVKSEMPKTKVAIDLLKKRDYFGLVDLCDTTNIVDKKTIVASLNKAENEYGILNDFQIFGFEFYKNIQGQTNLSICGIAISSKENHHLNIVTDPNDTALKIVLFNYKF